MGKFLDVLGGIGSAAGEVSGLASSIGNWLGLGQARQMRNQKELAEHAAELNYRYGEMAAENAFGRQMKMYERSYEDQSYQAMRNQMENAGLSVGLMYGGGASGGGAGATNGAPMGNGAGISNGSAPREAEFQSMAMELAKQSKEVQMMGSQIDVNKSVAEKNRAEAKEAEALEGKAKEDAETAREIRRYMVEGKRQEAISLFIKNCQEEWKSSELYSDEENTSVDYGNAELMFNYTIAQSSYNVEMFTATLDNLISETNKLDELTKLAKEQAKTEEEKRELLAAEKALKNQQTKYYFMEVMSKYLEATAAAQNAKTRIGELNLEITKAKAETIFRTFVQKNERLRTALSAVELAIKEELGYKEAVSGIVERLISTLATTAMMSMMM